MNLSFLNILTTQFLQNLYFFTLKDFKWTTEIFIINFAYLVCFDSAPVCNSDGFYIKISIINLLFWPLIVQFYVVWRKGAFRLRMTKMEIIVSFTSLLLNQRFSPNLTSSQCRFMFSPLHFLSVFSLVFLTTPTENVWKFFPQKICVYIVLLT